jgi:putative spermidine/putrescine transport system permease protein
MGDFVTIGVMGGQQIASIGKVIEVEMSYVHFPAAAANSVLLLWFVFLLVGGLSRSIDIRKELRQ